MSKTKSVAWMVSNCKTNSKREKYVNNLKKYIDVDVYGKCGPKKCQKNLTAECEGMLNKTYKFYLSFENSLCRDYISEKFFRNFAFRSHIVPVVRGGAAYKKYFPKDMFVDASDFRTAKELALHLRELGRDHLQYARMLREKDRLVALNWKLDWCDVCQKLHTNTRQSTISDIKEWSHLQKCHRPADLQ